MSNHEEYPEDLSGLTDEQLAELLADETASEAQRLFDEAPVTYVHDPETGSFTFSVLNPQNALHIGRNAQGEAYVENLGVDEDQRRRGLGSRLLYGAAVTLKEQGITTIVSDSTTADAINTLARLVPEELVTVYDADNREASDNPAFAMTLPQAALSSKLAQEYNESHPENEVEHLMGVRIDFGDIDLSSFPHPEER